MAKKEHVTKVFFENEPTQDTFQSLSAKLADELMDDVYEIKQKGLKEIKKRNKKTNRFRTQAHAREGEVHLFLDVEIDVTEDETLIVFHKLERLGIDEYLDSMNQDRKIEGFYRIL